MKTRQTINKYFDTIETILILGFAAAMIMILKEIKYSYWVLRFSLGALAILYWTKAIERNKGKDISEKISEKAVWFALLFAPLAILSKLQFSETANNFLLVSIVLLIVSFTYRLIERKKSKNKINIGEVTRLIFAALICLFLYSLPL